MPYPAADMILYFYLQLLRMADGNRALLGQGTALYQPRFSQWPHLPHIRLRDPVDPDLSVAGP